MSDDVSDGTQDEAVARAKSLINERERAQARNDLRLVLSSREGRRVLWWLFGQAGTFSGTYAPGDPTGTAFNEGKRSVGLALEHALAQADADALVLMQSEALRDRRAARDARQMAESDTSP